MKFIFQVDFDVGIPFLKSDNGRRLGAIHDPSDHININYYGSQTKFVETYYFCSVSSYYYYYYFLLFCLSALNFVRQVGRKPFVVGLRNFVDK